MRSPSAGSTSAFLASPPSPRSRILGAAVLVLTACPEASSPGDAKGPAPAETATPAEAPPSEARAQDLAVIDFDAAPIDALAPGFTITETHGTGTPARWIVRTADDAPSGEHVFGIAENTNHGQTYNLALLSEPSTLKDVEVQVQIHAGSGKEDRGGGIVFRARDPDNYYVIRWNPLEGNLRFYVLVNSERKKLAEAKLDPQADAWHELRIQALGDHVEAWFDDVSVLTAQDGALTEPGTVGLWSKADAAPWFDDFTVTPL